MHEKGGEEGKQLEKKGQQQPKKTTIRRRKRRSIPERKY
jgi:hypothetical protein